MKSVLIVICMLSALLLASSGCGESAPKELSVDASYSGKEAKIAVGGSLTATLESNPSTGFSWALVSISDPNVLEEGGHEFEAAQATPERPVVGASGQEVWTFKALKKGKSTISMEYSQPWEGGTKAAKTFVLTVLVD